MTIDKAKMHCKENRGCQFVLFKQLDANYWLSGISKIERKYISLFETRKKIWEKGLFFANNAFLFVNHWKLGIQNSNPEKKLSNERAKMAAQPVKGCRKNWPEKVEKNLEFRRTGYLLTFLAKFVKETFFWRKLSQHVEQRRLSFIVAFLTFLGSQ